MKESMTVRMSVKQKSFTNYKKTETNLNLLLKIVGLFVYCFLYQTSAPIGNNFV